MDYLTWNDRLASHFFRQEHEGCRIFLYVTSDILAEIAGRDDAVQDYVTAIKNGPPGSTRQGLCQRGLQTLERWRDRQGFPPYIAYLGLFVLAAGIEGDFAAHAYYPRLRQLLGEEPTSGQYPSFDRMLELWDDLEQWANEDQGGRLGIFRADIAGNWMHVGLPIAQTIITEHERESLPVIFSDAGLEPGSVPSDEQLAQILLMRGQRRLRPRTLQLLERNGVREVTLRNLVLQTVLDELHEWDGYCVQEEDNAKCISGALRLCGDLDRVASRLIVTLRCKSSQDLPEGGLALESDSIEGKFVCEEHVFDWSTELSDYDRMTKVDGSQLDWAHGALARSGDSRWLFRLSASEVRIFETGSSHGIPGIVECRRLPRQGVFYLVCSDRVSDEIKSWGCTNWATFEEIAIDQGLPSKWRMFAGSAPRNDKLIRDTFPMLAFNEGVRLCCEGGIQQTRNRYFTFAPPRISLDGGDEATTVWAHGIALVPQSETPGTFELPPEFARSGKLLIEAKRGGEVVARRSIYFSDDPIAPRTDSPWCDRFGRCVEQDASAEAVACGPIARGAPPAVEDFFLPQLPTIRRIILLGAKPGQIATWPKESLPSDWEPVWAVSMERRGSAVFCGTGINQAEPELGEFGDRRRVQHWKEVLWHWRRRISPPTHRGLKRLWERYQQKARVL